MNVELICVGSELVSGDVVNTNAAHISKKLRELGHEVFRQYTVDDNKERLCELVVQSLENCDILILTGGLGPTADDITKESVCEVLSLPLVENTTCRNHLNDYFKNYNIRPTENNFKQALAPEGAKIFKNDIGTACGLCIEQNGKHIIMLPGPHRELVRMFDGYVVAYLKRLNHRAIVTHSLNVFGMGESLIETLIKPLCGLDNPVVATYCGNNECEVKITATADTEAEAESICSRTMLKIREILGDCVYGADSAGLAHEVVNNLRASGLKISTAESCTGGMLSQSLTSVSHSSEVVEIGILAYSNRIKNEALSVPADVLNEYGAISPETAMYLAKNVRILSDSDIGVGITGNAGPSASENKPVGLVYVSIADKTKFFIKKLELPSHYDREKIRSYATLTALDLVRRYVAARPAAMPGMLSYDEPYFFESERPKIEVSAETDLSNPSADNASKQFDPNINFIVFDPEDYDCETELPVNSVGTEADSELDNNSADKTHLLKSKLSAFGSKISALLKRVFPNKDDKFKAFVIKIVSIIAIIGLLVSSGVLVFNFTNDNNQRNMIESARENFEFEATNRNDETKIYTAFDELIAANPDIKGWISISNTNVDNPIYQTDNNDFYLNHNMNKHKSRYGALFFDCSNTISNDTNSKNLTIYGHNMRDKSMFGSLSQYRSLKFYKNNPIINLKTLYQQKRYIIFAVMITNASPKDDNGYIYNFTKADFASDEEFNSWIAEAKERSLVDSGIEVTPEDDIITLSTCCYDFDNARFVIMAKSADEDDSASNAKLNSNVRYPQAWYDKKGLPGYKSSGSSDNNSSTPSSSDISSSDISSSDISSSDISSNVSSDNSESSDSTSSDSTSSNNSESTNTTSEQSSSQTSSTICNHVFEGKVISADYLCTSATCLKTATYYYSCVHCGVKSDTTFETGELGEHSHDGTWKNDAIDHWRICLVCGTEFKVEPHYYNDANQCDCGYKEN